MFSQTGIRHITDNLLKLDLDESSSNLAQNLDDILKALEGAMYLLHEPRKNDPKRKIKELIRTSLLSLKRELNAVKNIKIKIVVFGALGQGKSSVLNHLLRHGLNDQLTLLPSGYGGSKTPIPIRIRYSPHVKVTLNHKDKDHDSHGLNEVCLTCLGDIDVAHSWTAKTVSKILKNKKLFQDAKSLDVATPLPVFNHFSELIKKKCTYQDVNVELEIVDLPGFGDTNGDSLIGQELNEADIIMFFTSSKSGRPMTVYDICNVFQRRKIFDYANRPMFVFLANEPVPHEPELLTTEKRVLHEKREKELHSSWDDLMKCKDESDDCYKIVFERLPQSSTENWLETFKKESKAIVFRPGDKDFADCVGDVIVEQANNVCIKRNAHPFVQTIFKLTSKLIILTKYLIDKHKRVTPTKDSTSSQVCFRPLEKLPFEISMLLDGNFLRYLPKLKDLVKLPNFKAAHEEILQSFKQESTILHLVKELQNSLQKHWKKLIAASQQKNKLSFSEPSQSFVLLAEITCNDLVAKFMAESARNFVFSNINRLGSKLPKKGFQAEWESQDDEEREVFLLDHCHYLVQELSRFFEHGTRGQSLQNILDNLHGTVQNFMMAVVQHNDPDVKQMILQKVDEKLDYVAKFTLTRMREVNPHQNLVNRCLTSKMDYPDMKDLKSSNNLQLPQVSPNTIFQNLFKMLKNGKGNPLSELQRKLNLPVNSLRIPDGLDEFHWVKVLLNVMYDPTFHHANFGDDCIIDCALKVPLHSVPKQHLDTAKQQLFAYQKSTASCKIIEDESAASDTINIQINETKDRLTASGNSALINELKTLISLDDPKMQLAPIFMPCVHYGASKDTLGNIYLEDDPWKVGDDDNNGHSMGEQNTEQATGLEDLKATIFCVVESDKMETLRETLKRNPPNKNIRFWYVVLPQNCSGLGVSMSVIKILAESMELPFYWIIDDDLKKLNEFDGNSLTWVNCSFARGLLHGQRVLQDCTDKAVNHIDATQRSLDLMTLLKIFPEGADAAIFKVGQLMIDVKMHDRMLNNISCLNGEFSEEMMKKDCLGDPTKERKWLQAKTKCIDELKRYLLKDSFQRIAGVSVGHTGGPGFSFHCSSFFKGVHYRRDTSRRFKHYKMVLHNTEALKGFNYLPDSIFQESSNQIGDVQSGYPREIRWQESLLQALDFYGVYSFETLAIYLENKSHR